MFWRFAPESVWKNSLDVRSAVFVFVLSSLRFSPTSLCFFWFKFSFERHSSGSNRNTRTFVCCSGSLFCPAVVSPFLAVRPASWRSLRGAILGPARCLGFSWNSWGLSSLAPSEALFGREAARGFSWLLVLGFVCFVLRPRFFQKPEVGDLTEVGHGDLPAPSPK